MLNARRNYTETVTDVWWWVSALRCACLATSKIQYIQVKI